MSPILPITNVPRASARALILEENHLNLGVHSRVKTHEAVQKVRKSDCHSEPFADAQGKLREESQWFLSVEMFLPSHGRLRRDQHDKTRDFLDSLIRGRVLAQRSRMGMKNPRITGHTALRRMQSMTSVRRLPRETSQLFFSLWQ